MKHLLKVMNIFKNLLNQGQNKRAWMKKMASRIFLGHLTVFIYQVPFQIMLLDISSFPCRAEDQTHCLLEHRGDWVKCDLSCIMHLMSGRPDSHSPC